MSLAIQVPVIDGISKIRHNKLESCQIPRGGRSAPKKSGELAENAKRKREIGKVKVLNGSSRSMERVDALEALIRDSAHKLEDVLEFHELKQLEEEDEEGDEEGMVRQEICSFGEQAKRLEQEYLVELSRDDEDDDEYTTYPDFGVEMIGRSDLFDTILQRHVFYRMRPDDRYIYPFLGEQGSGSRVVVKHIFEYARKEGKLERWGWAKGYEVKDVLRSLIAQVEADVDDESLADATDDQLSEYLYKALENRSYMIVLDGVDDMELLNYLRSKSFPDQSNGSVVLVTTASMEVALSGDIFRNFVMSDIVKEDVWLKIRHKLFGWESIPTELEVAGKEILQKPEHSSFYLIPTRRWSSGAS